MERSWGDLCAIIDSDDWYMPEALKWMLARWEEIPVERCDDSQLAYWTEYGAMQKPMRVSSRLRAHANYVRYSPLGGRRLRQLLDDSLAASWSVAALPPGLVLYFRDRRWLARNAKRVEAWSS